MCRYFWVVICENPAEIKDALRNISRKNMDMTFLKRWMKFVPTYRFNETCQDTVPQAIVALLESTDFEDAIRNAISLGGDSDTLVQSQEVLPKQLMEFLSGLRIRLIPISMSL